ncbi:MAG: GTP-binding protein, partial [Ilumatobacteraceae bacterium]
ERVLASVTDRLSLATIAMTSVDHVGDRGATVVAYGPHDQSVRDDLTMLLAEHDDGILSRSVIGNERCEYDVLRQVLAACTQQARVHPVYFGSALTGAGVDLLMGAVAELLPARDRTGDGAVAGVVFKIEHASTGERWAIVRMVSGTLRIRDLVLVGGAQRRVTNIAVFERGGTSARGVVVSGQIAKISGLGDVRIGDAVGEACTSSDTVFAPPLFEAVVAPVDAGDRRPLRAALELLAAEDPLINVRQEEVNGQLSVSLYGEMQRQVISEMLRRDFGIPVVFSDTTTIHVERLAGAGVAEETMLGGRAFATPFLAGVGLYIEPAPPGAGFTFSAGVELGRLPVAFINAVEEAVRTTLPHGLHGCAVSDCTVTMSSSGYLPRQSHAHATFDKNMSSIAMDFRLLTPLVLIEALRNAGTIVHEPVHRFRLDAPAATLGTVVRALTSFGATPGTPEHRDSWVVIRGLVPAARLAQLRQQLPGLTGGEGSIESTFDSHRPINGPVPERHRPEPNPLDRHNYLRQIANRP